MARFIAILYCNPRYGVVQLIVVTLNTRFGSGTAVRSSFARR